MADDVLPVNWPIGPDYDDWVGADGAGADDVGAWVAFKLKSGAFHIDTLEAVGRVGGFSRLAGIEMALDSSLAALCGAFDASVAGIFRAAEFYFLQGERSKLPWKTIAPHNYNWARCKDPVLKHLLAEPLSYDIAGMSADIDLALRQQDDQPLGWLTSLQRLRNRAVHQQSLARHIDADVGGQASTASWTLTVGTHVNNRGVVIDPGRSEPPVTYLRTVHAQLGELTARMVGLVRHIYPHGVPIPRQSRAT